MPTASMLLWAIPQRSVRPWICLHSYAFVWVLFAREGVDSWHDGTFMDVAFKLGGPTLTTIFTFGAAISVVRLHPPLPPCLAILLCMNK